MTRSLCQRMVLAEMTATQLINRWYVYYLESSWLITNPNIIKSRKAHSATSLHVVEHGNCLRDKRLELIQVQTTSRTCELAANPYDLRVDRFVSLRGLSVTKCWHPWVQSSLSVYQSSFINDPSLSGFQKLFVHIVEMPWNACPGYPSRRYLCHTVQRYWWPALGLKPVRTRLDSKRARQDSILPQDANKRQSHPTSRMLWIFGHALFFNILRLNIL